MSCEEDLVGVAERRTADLEHPVGVGLQRHRDAQHAVVAGDQQVQRAPAVLQGLRDDELAVPRLLDQHRSHTELDLTVQVVGVLHQHLVAVRRVAVAGLLVEDVREQDQGVHVVVGRRLGTHVGDALHSSFGAVVEVRPVEFERFAGPERSLKELEVLRFRIPGADPGRR